MIAVPQGRFLRGTPPAPSLRSAGEHAYRRHRGFTMVELIVVMVIVGIMAVTVLPRMDALTSFDAVGYADQLRSVLRYAQKSALAQRRAVAVDFSGALPTLSIAAGSTCSGAFGAMTYPVTLRSRSGATPSPVFGGGLVSAWVCFDTMGKPFRAASVALAAVGTITISDAPVVSIEPETGYVH